MSRAYRVRVAESLRTTVRGEDCVTGSVELLEVLPREEMAGVVAAELEAGGFERRPDGTMARVAGDVEVVVDPRTGAVTARAVAERELDLRDEACTNVTDDRDVGMTEAAWDARVAGAQAALREQARARLAAQASAQALALRQEATAALEKALADVRPALDAAVNRATAAALKRRAAQLGTIKEIAEEPDGSLTIKVEL